ncbi:hypothetical protein [Desulfosarcina cetonica]|uniref:hypothetical protein n=1 Tax=Desulfosarcina cetonica TaxID=90730 RepID=UPI001FEE108D|nr:hypothetical protein [Desulfosarcina cetonica]
MLLQQRKELRALRIAQKLPQFQDMRLEKVALAPSLTIGHRHQAVQCRRVHRPILGQKIDDTAAGAAQILIGKINRGTELADGRQHGLGLIGR